MKQLLFIFLFAVSVLFANAQSGTGTLIATSKVNGGDGTGTIVSTSWAVQGTPPAPVTFVDPNAATTNFTVTSPGVYTFVATVKDNLGNIQTTVWVATAFLEQSISVDVSKSTLKIVIKKQ